ncbi:hypothetical protein [Kocuria rosea]|uniref:hypothetical protein n=1 Tax=Kocuria rosea TaxID=1275 RepID=UPI0016436D24|nr:hypothetical protein [Kocuria rosea]
MLIDVNMPGERCTRSALYRVYDKKFRRTDLWEYVPAGRRFPKAGPGDSYWPVAEL